MQKHVVSAGLNKLLDYAGNAEQLVLFFQD